MALSDDLNALFEKFIPVIRDALKAAIADVVDNTVLTNVQRAIEAGDVEAAFRALGFSDAAMRPITKTIEDAFEQGGITTAASFRTPVGSAVFRFDIRNSRAEQWLRDESSTLISGIEDDIRAAVRNVMFEGVKAGRNGRTIAYDLVGRLDENGNRSGGLVGLTNPMQQATFRARQELNDLSSKYFLRERRDKRFDRLIQRHINDGTKLTQTEIDKIVMRYANSLLLLRGENIGRTEAHRALEQSSYESLKQAVENGTIAEGAVTRVWDDTGDFRTRHDHRIMNGQKVGLNEPFKTPDNRLLMYPGDTSLTAKGEDVINCRCRSRLKIDWVLNMQLLRARR